ncbi:MAG: hypothetical protein IT328_27790, partial [Caldilineaceae bacterium]|nr:hypothetical protein [Caldilineaceae bacterium]
MSKCYIHSASTATLAVPVPALRTTVSAPAADTAKRHVPPPATTSWLP